MKPLSRLGRMTQGYPFCGWNDDLGTNPWVTALDCEAIMTTKRTYFCNLCSNTIVPNTHIGGYGVIITLVGTDHTIDFVDCDESEGHLCCKCIRMLKKALENF